MKVKKTLPNCQVIIEKEIKPQDISELEDIIIKKKSKEVKIPGFRAGKAPKEKIFEVLAKSGEFQELFNIEMQKQFIKKWHKENSDTHGEITRIIGIKEKSPELLEFTIEYFPIPSQKDIEKEYKNIKVNKVKAEELKVEEGDIKKNLDELQKKRTMLQPSKDELKKDHYAFLRITPEKKAKSDKENRNLFHLGDKQYGEDFEKKIAGVKEGEEKVLEIVDIQKKESSFLKQLLNSQSDKEITEDKIKVKVKAEKIFVSETPKLDDEFAKSLGKFKSLDELKKSMKDGILMEKLYAERNKRRDELMKYLTENIKLDIPQSMIEKVTKDNMAEFENQLKVNATTEASKEKIENEMKAQKEKLEISFRDRAEQELKMHRIIDAIATWKKITPAKEELEKEMAKVLKNFKSPKEAENMFGSIDNLKSRVLRSLTHQKTIKYLEKENKINEDIDKKIAETKKKLK